MDGQGKQRLVGVILLLLLAAILAPFVFRGPEEVRVSLEMDVPASPPVAEVTPEPVITTEQVEETEARIERERQAVRESAEMHAAREDSGEDLDEPPLGGWAVQVASFSQRDNAVALERELREAGYNAYWREARPDGEALYRVYAGPELDRDEAQALRRRLARDEAFGLEGLVVPYEP